MARALQAQSHASAESATTELDTGAPLGSSSKVDTVKTFLKLAAGTVATLSLAGAAQAGCGAGSLYCGASTGTSTLPPLSSYYAHGASGHAVSSYSAPSYTMSHSQASSSYGSGSISSTYSLDSTYSFSGPVSSAPGLGAGESLQPTSCPVSVDSPAGSRVLGCYSVVRKVYAPVARTTYYRVVRPVVYVRYPVPVPVPYTVYSPCATNVAWSRYGDYHRYGYGHGGCY